MAEQSNTLPESLRADLDCRLNRVIRKVGSKVDVLGQYNYYYRSWDHLPTSFTGSVRSLVRAAWPDDGYEKEDGKRQLHPFAYAAERGLVIGSRIAALALSQADYVEYISAQTESLKAIEQSMVSSAHGLEETLMFTGRRFVPRIGSISPSLVDLDTPGSGYDLRLRSQIFADGVGYMFAGTVEELSVQALRTMQHPNPSVHEDLRVLAENLGAASTNVTSEVIEEIL